MSTHIEADLVSVTPEKGDDPHVVLALGCKASGVEMHIALTPRGASALSDTLRKAQLVCRIKSDDGEAA